MKNVDHSYEQALIMHENVHIHVIMNIIVTPTDDSAQVHRPKAGQVMISIGMIMKRTLTMLIRSCAANGGTPSDEG